MRSTWVDMLILNFRCRLRIFFVLQHHRAIIPLVIKISASSYNSHLANNTMVNKRSSQVFNQFAPLSSLARSPHGGLSAAACLLLQHLHGTSFLSFGDEVSAGYIG
jgi:hypothetical protein